MQIITEDDGSRWLSIDGDMSTTTLWNALESVLREKGATDAWLAYALPDLHTAATQFACHEFTRGYQGGERGTGCGAYDPPRVGSEMIKAPLPAYMPDTPAVREALQRLVEESWHDSATATGERAVAAIFSSEPSLQELADQDQAEYEDMREAFKAGYKYGNELDRGADLSDHCFAEWMSTQIVEGMRLVVPEPYTPPWIKLNEGNAIPPGAYYAMVGADGKVLAVRPHDESKGG